MRKLEKRVLVAIAVLAVVAIVYPFFMPYGTPAKKSRACVTKLKLIAVATSLYTTDNSGKLPPASHWVDALQPMAQTGAFTCPALHQEGGFGYAMNRFLSHKPVATLEAPASMSLIHETTNLDRNANEYLPLFPYPSRHDDLNNVLFADGHVKGFRLPSSR